LLLSFLNAEGESAYHMSGPPGEIHHLTVGVSRIHNLAIKHLMD
jgi:hypothetical protein